MDNKIKKALYILIILGIAFMLNLLLEPISNMFNQIVSLLAPFLFGFAGAFILHPLVDYLVSKKINRLVAILILVVFILFIGTLFIVQLLPMLLEQFSSIVVNGPDLFTRIIDSTSGILEEFNLSLSQFEIDWKETVLNGVNSSYSIFRTIISGVLSSISFIFLTPILLIYFLFDYNRIREWLKSYLRNNNHNTIYNFLKDLENLLSRYVGGLLLVMVTLSVISFIMFKLSGLENALLFGFIIGLTNLIPFIGNILGGVLAAAFALTQSTTLAIIIAIEVLVLTFIESNIVTPFIQSKNTEIHPIVIILGMTIFGYIFGFIGVLLAIPLIITTKLLFKYRNS